jgi:hypothetical protein
MQTTKLVHSEVTPATKYYSGFAHCHSNHSYDGKYSYAELREIFLKQNLDFVCMTEHIETLDQAKVDNIISACRAHSDENFVFIPGIEMDDFVIYFVGVDHVDIDFSSAKSIFDSLFPVASLCVFSHPVKAKHRYPQWLMECCDGVEIWNTKHDGIHYPRRESLALLAEVKKHRPHAIPLVGMDFHNKGNLSPARFRLLKQGPLTEAFILDEIKAGRLEVFKGEQPIASISTFAKYGLWLRILLMDYAHTMHLGMSKSGLTIPKPVKRYLRKLMEGA